MFVVIDCIPQPYKTLIQICTSLSNVTIAKHADGLCSARLGLNSERIHSYVISEEEYDRIMNLMTNYQEEEQSKIRMIRTAEE